MHTKQTVCGESNVPGTAWVMKFLSPTVGLTEAGAGVMHSIDGHAGVFDEKVFHRTGFHLDSG